MQDVEKYRLLGCIPGGAKKNFISYGHTISKMTQQQREILCDAQTSGGLLVIVKDDDVDKFLEVINKADLDLKPIGRTLPKDRYLVEVI